MIPQNLFSHTAANTKIQILFRIQIGWQRFVLQCYLNLTNDVCTLKSTIQAHDVIP
jgi:hypothetical protein